jgi:hypothetical protein
LPRTAESNIAKPSIAKPSVATLSAVRPRFCRRLLQTSCGLIFLLASVRAQRAPCGPSPEIRAQLEKTAVVVSGPSGFDRALAPLAALRQRYPNDLWVNLRYQDAVQEYGIEGHLRKLTEEYQVLSMQHPDDVMYSYLYARSLMGRNTSGAAQQMTEIVSDHPGFAPAHGSLAEIYASAVFHDESKEKVERQAFLALCPGSDVKLQQRPAEIPEPSLLLDQAESLLSEHADPDRITAIAEQGIRDDEWRMQRIRPFDWYTVDYKRQAQRDLHAKYWRLWSIEVRCHRLAGRPEKAAALLAAMEQRAMLLHSESDPVYWDALATLVRLYQEGNQKAQAKENLDSMQQFLAAHPDPGHSAQLEDLQKLAGESNK